MGIIGVGSPSSMRKLPVWSGPSCVSLVPASNSSSKSFADSCFVTFYSKDQDVSDFLPGWVTQTTSIKSSSCLLKGSSSCSSCGFLVFFFEGDASAGSFDDSQGIF